MDGHGLHSGPDPSRVATLDDLVRELGLLRFRAARGTRSARVSLDELAGRVSEPKSTIHSYLTGKRLPPAQLLDRIVIALGSSPAELHEWAEAWYRVGAVRDAARRGLADGQLRRPVPHQLPLPVDGFVGRSDALLELDESVACSRPTRIALLSGTAGVGKTALAVRWAHGRADKFPGGQLYLDLRGFDPAAPMQPAHALARLLHALGAGSSETSLDVDALAGLYRSELSGRRVLIVLDNASDVEQVRPLLPGTSKCAVVVTSRDSMAGLIARHGGHRIDLPLLPMDDATELLRALIGEQSRAVTGGATTPSELSDSDLVALAERCARLPLALRITAELAGSRPGVPLGQLVRELSVGRRQLDLLQAGDDARSALRAVFSWSYRRLPEPVAAAFRLLGVQQAVDLTVEAMAALIGITVLDAERAVDVLVRSHLIEEHHPGRYRVHGLLHSYAGELARSTDAEAGRRAALVRPLDYYLNTAVLAIDLLSADHRRAPGKSGNGSWARTFADVATAAGWLDAEYANIVSAMKQTENGDAGLCRAELAQTVARHLAAGTRLPTPRAAGSDAPAVVR